MGDIELGDVEGGISWTFLVIGIILTAICWPVHRKGMKRVRDHEW